MPSPPWGRFWLNNLVREGTVGWHPGAGLLTRALAQNADGGEYVALTLARYSGALAEGESLPVQTILSRFRRVNLPTPRAQRVLFRLGLVVWAQHDGYSLSDIAKLLEFCHPTHLQRFVRRYLGREFREIELTTADDYRRMRIDPVLQWADPRWQVFNPFAPVEAVAV